MSLLPSFLLLIGAVVINIALAEESVVSICSRAPAAVFAHPDKCHQYFKCSADSDRLYSANYVDSGSENSFLHECPYPQLFNEVTRQCEDYRHVKCGKKFLPLDKCEYTRYLLRFRRGPSCHEWAPSCKGLADGVRVYRGREWSPYVTICQDQRLLNTSTCETEIGLNRVRLFSPDLGRCASLYEIPKHHGGLFLNCTGRADGLYFDDVSGNPNVFFRCFSKATKEVYLCPTRQQSDTKALPCLTLVSV